MKRNIIFLVLILNCFLADAQEKCPGNKRIIMSFLQTKSDSHFKSTLRDFYKFFNGVEIEGGLRHEYVINKGIELSWDDINSRSLAIDRLLNDTTFKRLLMIKKKKNSNWAIFSSYKVEPCKNFGPSAIIYVVGIAHSGGSIQLKFVNSPNMDQCGISDILGPTGESIYSSIYFK